MPAANCANNSDTRSGFPIVMDFVRSQVFGRRGDRSSSEASSRLISASSPNDGAELHLFETLASDAIEKLLKLQNCHNHAAGPFNELQLAKQPPTTPRNREQAAPDAGDGGGAGCKVLNLLASHHFGH